MSHSARVNANPNAGCDRIEGILEINAVSLQSQSILPRPLDENSPSGPVE